MAPFRATVSHIHYDGHILTEIDKIQFAAVRARERDRELVEWMRAIKLMIGNR